MLAGVLASAIYEKWQERKSKMTALGCNAYFQTKPSVRAKSPEYLAVSHKIEELWARCLRICDDEIVDEINRLKKRKRISGKTRSTGNTG